MPLAPEGVRRTRDTEGWCAGCGREMVYARAWWVLQLPDRCVSGPRIGQLCSGDADPCPECEYAGDIGCPCEDTVGDDGEGKCGVCTSRYRIPCPVCRPDALAKRQARVRRDAGLTEPAPDGQLPTDAVENLPTYRRYLDGMTVSTLAELQLAMAAVRRYRDLGAHIAGGLDVLTGLDVDTATLAEGQRVADAVLTAGAHARELSDAASDLYYTVRMAVTGAARHDTAQDIHAAGLLADPAAYSGA